MKIEVTLPRLTETMEEATLVAWHKKPGDYVEKKEILYEVETDKVTMEVESIDPGYLCEILIPEGETADVGAVIAVLADSAEECT